MKNLKQMYHDHVGKTSDKWSFYLDKYDNLFNLLRNTDVCLLEIGIQNGGSLEIWANYFKDNTVIIGCDINPDCQELIFTDSRIHVIVNDINSDEAEQKITTLCKELDIIIDDGSHTSSDIVRSFQRYFKHLKDGGVFIVEDLHCSYWQEFEGGLHAPYSAIAFFKRLADITSFEHWGTDLQRHELLRGFAKTYGIDFEEETLSHIQSVEFANSLCIIRKAAPSANLLGNRIIIGDESLVIPITPDIITLAGKESTPLSQISNPHSIRPSPPEEELYQRLDELRLVHLHTEKLNERIELLKRQNHHYAQRLHKRIKQWYCNSLDLQKTLKNFDKQKDSLNLSLSEKDDEITTIRQTLNIKEKEVTQLSNSLKLKDQDISAIFRSTSWKISAPIRCIGRQLLRIKRAYEIFTAQRVRSVSARQDFKKLATLLRTHGLRGVKDYLERASVRLEQEDGTAEFNYANWIMRFDRIDSESLQRQVETANKFEHQPLISVLMPVYNAPPSFLEAAIRSVIQQSYRKWELCIADDASTAPQVTKLLNYFERIDRRIKVVHRDNNGHISNSSNSALELAEGEFVALLDQDDLIPEHALFLIVQTINENRDAGIIYSDEDKLDKNNLRTDPYFKPDFNLYLFRSQNMISHFGVYRTELVRSVGGFRPGFEGAQDYDLALRCMEQLQRNQIVHIPRVLYHWRIHAGSTAQAVTEKPYAAQAGVNALQDHLQRTGCTGDVILEPTGMYRIKYSLPAPAPMVSLIIPTRNAYKLLKQCINSIQKLTTYQNFEIILIDNGSDDPKSLEYFSELARDPKVRVLRDDGPFNYSALNNRAVQLAQGEYIGLINNDIEVITPNWLEEMVSLAAQPDVGAVGARLWYPDNRLQHGGVILGIGGVANHAHKFLPKGEYGYFGRASLIQEFSAVTAACLIVKKSIFNQVGGLNDVNLKIAFNDVDLCLKIQEAGYVNVWTPYAELYHHESASRGQEDSPEKQARFQSEVKYMQERWPDILADYAYNPNLTLTGLNFELGWPPRTTL